MMTGDEWWRQMFDDYWWLPMRSDDDWWWLMVADYDWWWLDCLHIGFKLSSYELSVYHKLIFIWVANEFHIRMALQDLHGWGGSFYIFGVVLWKSRGLTHIQVCYSHLVLRRQMGDSERLAACALRYHLTWMYFVRFGEQRFVSLTWSLYLIQICRKTPISYNSARPAFQTNWPSMLYGTVQECIWDPVANRICECVV